MNDGCGGGRCPGQPSLRHCSRESAISDTPSLLGFGAYLGILFAAGLAFGGYTVNQESTRAGTTG